MKNCFRTAALFSLLLGVYAVAGCSSTVDELTNTVNCHSVCDRYAECFDADFDVDGCTDRCENEADASENRQQRLEACNNCIDDRSCTSATFNCATECAGVVP